MNISVLLVKIRFKSS